MKVVVLLSCSACLYGLILWALYIVHGINCVDCCCSTFCDDFDFATVKIMLATVKMLLYSSDDGLLSDHVFVADSTTVKIMLATVKMLLSSIDDYAQLIVSNCLSSPPLCDYLLTNFLR